jgi:hypothetical protein
VPSREAAVFCLCLLQSSIQLEAKLAFLCAHACEALLAQVAASFFVPFCLSAAAVAARLRVLSGSLLMHSVNVYGAMVPVAAMLPRGDWLKQGSSGQTIPEMARISWVTGLPSVTFLPFESGAQGFSRLAEQLAEQFCTLQSAGSAPVSRQGTLTQFAQYMQMICSDVQLQVASKGAGQEHGVCLRLHLLIVVQLVRYFERARLMVPWVGLAHSSS